MGHTVRVINQRIAVKKELAELQDHPDRAYIVIDYKMKMIQVYFREKTIDHYGKKVMSWHGAMVYTKQTCEENDDPDSLHKLLTTYYDHISDGDSKQDWQAVLAICEAIMCNIEIDYPHIKEIVFQSDNARCYQSASLIYGLMLISCNREKLRIIRLIHTETQDGKCSIDAHFAIAMACIMRYVNEGNNVISPVQLVYALSNNAHLNNVSAELFSFDRSKIDQLVSDNKGFEVCNSQINRINEVTFDYVANTLTIFDYSNINSIIIQLDSGTDSMTEMAGNESNDENDMEDIIDIEFEFIW